MEEYFYLVWLTSFSLLAAGIVLISDSLKEERSVIPNRKEKGKEYVWDGKLPEGVTWEQYYQ